MGFDPEAIVHARFIVAWGANIVSSNVHLWPFVEEARRRGAQLVTVDPYRSRTAEHADRHLALSFLVMIGLSLIVEGWDSESAEKLHLKNYIYFGMAFSFMVELLNLTMVKRQKKRRVVQLNQPKLEEDVEENSDEAK